MKKGLKFSLGAVLAAAAFATCPTVQAAELGDTVTMFEPAVALVMPFDVTENHASFQLVSRIGGEDSDPIATHWSFWSESCDHLADVFICLTPRDTVVVDPTALQGQIQSGQTNTNTGPVINLSGTKGFITVTAFDADLNSQTCEPEDPESRFRHPEPDRQLGRCQHREQRCLRQQRDRHCRRPDASRGWGLLPHRSGRRAVSSCRPSTRSTSRIPRSSSSGWRSLTVMARSHASEIGPIPAALANGAAVCCNA